MIKKRGITWMVQDLVWYKCKECGKPAFTNLKTGEVGHTKPTEKLGVPNSVNCRMFQQYTAEQYAAFHSDAPRLPSATEMKPFTN